MNEDTLKEPVFPSDPDEAAAVKRKIAALKIVCQQFECRGGIFLCVRDLPDEPGEIASQMLVSGVTKQEIFSALITSIEALSGKPLAMLAYEDGSAYVLDLAILDTVMGAVMPGSPGADTDETDDEE